MIIIKNLVNTCTSCPSQWQAETSDGAFVYIRYRWDRLYVTIRGAIFFEQDNVSGDSDGLHGSIDTDEMLTLTGLVVGESAE